MFDVIARIPVGDWPFGVTVSPDGSRAYAANVGCGTVSVIDTATNTVTATVGFPPTHSLAVVGHPDGTRLYIGQYGVVSVVDMATNAITTNIPVSEAWLTMAILPDGTKLYAGCNTLGKDGSVAVIDTAAESVEATISVGDIQQCAPAVSPDGTRVYVSDHGGKRVAVIDTATNRIVGSINIGATPGAVVVGPDGTRLYVTSIASPDTVRVVNTATGAVTATIPVREASVGIAISPDGSLVYVTGAEETVSVIDTATDTVTAAIRVATSVGAVAATPDGSAMYVTNHIENTVSVVSRATSPNASEKCSVAPTSAVA